MDGKSVIISEDRAKTKSSLRALPLVGHFREKLLELKEQQKENKRACGNCYNYKYDGYIFVDVNAAGGCFGRGTGNYPTSDGKTENGRL